MSDSLEPPDPGGTGADTDRWPRHRPWSDELVQRGRAVRLVALDVDGVLTDGGIHLDSAGVESKRFHVRDGLGIRLLLEADYTVGLITARNSPMVAHRGRELGLSFVHQGVKDKWGCLENELTRHRLTPDRCAFMGDDLIDLPILSRVGFAGAPADADPEVVARVHWLARRRGGRGAVRELAEGLLRARDLWQRAVASRAQR